MPKNIDIPNISDKEYYYLSRFSYNYDKIKKSLKENRPLTTSSSSRWYVEKIKSDDDTGLDAVVLSQAEEKNGKWVKSDNPKNVVVAFAGTDAGKDPIDDLVKADGGNIVMGQDPKKKTHYH